MDIKDWKKELFSIPNLLSLFRLILIPVYISIYLNARDQDDYFLAATILAVSCLTDLIDGKIARRFNMITNVGKLLDPLADKLTQFALILCLALRHPVLWYVVGLFFIKELMQLIGCAIGLRKGLTMTGSLMPGKICTTVLFLSLILMVMFPGISKRIVSVIAVIDSAFLLLAFISYIYAFFSKKAKNKVFIDENTL
jgi:cardiolipin synthase